MEYIEYIPRNLAEVDKNIFSACQNSGRNPNEVTLICVSKTKPVEMLKVAYDAGKRHFGENKVQEMVQKAPELPSDIVWHMIGHLQKNKVRKAVQIAEWIHSVDSYELVELINSEAERINKVQKICIEINVGEEESKYGLSFCAAEDLIQKAAQLKNIHICGIMCVAPYTENPENNRPYFQNMNNFIKKMNSLNLENIHLDTLSMGMSGDYQIAVEEGSTFVRVGTSIFGERDYSK